MANKTAFDRFANTIADGTGHPAASVGAFLVIVIWAVTGHIFAFSDSWQLVINTGTTIVTFLMVFLIQSTQNRDAKAMQIKLDELIRAMEGAHNVLLDLEELSEEDLRRVRQRYLELARHAREAIERGIKNTGHPEVELGEAVARSLSGKKIVEIKSP